MTTEFMDKTFADLKRLAEVIEHDFSPEPVRAVDEDSLRAYALAHQAKTCSDCGLYFKGDCPYQTGLFGCEPTCERFLDPELIAETETEVPF